jgi:hypothetical protein
MEDEVASGVCAVRNCRGDDGIDAKRSRRRLGEPVMGHAILSGCFCLGPDQRITSGPAP